MAHSGGEEKGEKRKEDVTRGIVSVVSIEYTPIEVKRDEM